MQIIELPIGKLRPDKNQPRQTFDQDKINEMAQSILTEGIINPIEVDSHNIIITGEMRWRAAKVAKLATVPVKVLKINPKERYRRQVIENIHNMTMNPMDTARALKKLLLEVHERLAFIKKQKGGLPDQGIRQLSREIGMPQSTLEEYLGLFEASRPLQKAIAKEEIPYTMLRAINRTPQIHQKEMEKKILAGEFKTRTSALELVAALNRSPEKAQELLEVDYSKFPSSDAVGNKVGSISPRYYDQVVKALEPTQEFRRIKNDLIKWLDSNSPQSILGSHRLNILMGIAVLIKRLAFWTTKANQKELNGN